MSVSLEKAIEVGYLPVDDLFVWLHIYKPDEVSPCAEKLRQVNACDVAFEPQIVHFLIRVMRLLNHVVSMLVDHIQF